MSWAGEPDVVTAIWEALDRSKVVSSVVLVGSRARGTATELSDWDLCAEGDPDGMVAEIPALVASLGPLAAFWEPLAEGAGYMVVMDGPIKVDVFPIGASRRIQPPWLFLLAPLGVASAPASLNEAVASYHLARAPAMDALRVIVRQELGRQVSEALQRHGLLT